LTLQNCKFNFTSLIIFKEPTLGKKQPNSDIQLQKELKESGEIPAHIAIIMDGNGRWAKRRGLPRAAGHKKGVDTVRDIVEACAEIGVKYLTLYTFSTENWNRPKDEVSTVKTVGPPLPSPPSSFIILLIVAPPVVVPVTVAIVSPLYPLACAALATASAFLREGKGPLLPQ